MKGLGGIALRARGLAKSYGEVKAVRGVDLELREGEIYGFLGRNGAGKTTTVRMLLGLIRPDSGEVGILGSSLGEDRAGVLSRVGYLVESAAAYPNLTVRENLDIQRRLTRSPRAAVGETMELMRIAQYAERKASALSMGNKQRLSLARALLHKPRLLILDEPINGLDPAGIVEIRGLLRRLADEEGATVFMSSHLLGEVEQLADRVGIVHGGLLIEELDCRELRSSGRSSVEVEVDDPERALGVLREELGMSAMTRSGPSSLRISDAGAEPSRIARSLVGAGIALERLERTEEDLESRFMRLTGGAA
jgi:ABC-type multidrug transport system ATPase subunit